MDTPHTPHEIEPDLVTSVDKGEMWGTDERRGELPRVALDASQAAMVHEIQRAHRTELERLLVSLASSLRTRRHVVPFYVNGAGGVGASIQRNLNNFPDLGQWALETVIYWADPAASANLQANVTLDASMPVPVPLTLSKAGAASLLLGGLPVIQQDTVNIAVTGGASGDRGVVLLVFKREG